MLRLFRVNTQSLVAVAAVVAVIGMFSACTKDYVTGKSTFSLVGEDQEIEMGRQADVEIVAEFGLYNNEDLAKYIDQIGQEIARVSQRPQLDYTFRILDSPVVNAFALPGGWTYVTRGILAYLGSEAELVGVMGHEVGHVVARHGAEQMSRQVLAGAGVGLLQRVPILRDVAGTGAGLLFLSFSRGQETESDELGVEYATKLGYDGARLSDFFGTLGRLGDQGGQRIPNFLSTHPDPGDRQARVAQLSAEWQQKVDYKPRNDDPYVYLKRIDGIPYGPDPRQGFVERNMFYHPDLRFQFTVPDGWKLNNSPHLVDIVNEDQSAAITFTLAQERPAAAAADSFVARSGVRVSGRKPLRVNNNQAIAIESSIEGRSGQIKVLSYFIAYDGGVYVFHGLAPIDLWGRHVTSFRAVFDSFDRVTNRRVLAVKPDLLRIRKAPRAGVFEAVIQSLGVIEGNFSEHALINGRSLSDPIEKGAWLKIIERQTAQ